MKIFFSIFLFTFSQFLGAQTGSPKVEIKNIGPLVNSSFSDFSPLISADGSTMVFTSVRPTDKTNSSPNATAKKDGQKIKEANSAIFITYYNDKSKTWIEPIMLESVVNLSGVDNSAIALSNDGQRMLLYRSGNNKNINKGVFETTLKGNEWSVPKRLPAPINSDGNNSDGNETSASFSPDGKTIYFVSSRPGGLGGRDIWYCMQNEAGNWGEAVNIGDLINTKEDEESVFLHPNGSSLFFSSKGHNSSGGYDIFVSHLDTVTNSWAKAINLGSPVNTPGDDLYFVMAANEKTAYYASSKPKVSADKDIYSITFPESILSKHITLVKGFVIGENGLGIESKIVVKEKLTGDIFTTLKSNKAIGKFVVSLPATGEYQINFTDDNNGTYTEFIEASENSTYNEVVLNIVLEPKYANIFCRVLNEEGNPIPKVQIELIDIITKQLIGKFETNSAGGSRFSLPFETKFNIVFSKPGYLFQSVNVSIPKSSGSESKDIKDITLQKVEVGKKITINNVFFDFNQEIPQQQSFADLDRIIKLMNDMNSLHVEISGHTDNVGFQDNKKLSEQKAKAVMNYLVGKGCEKSRLKYKGYGSTDPIATNETAEGRQINSRIELKVLKVDLIAEQKAEEKRIESGSENVNVDVISPFPIINEEEQISENKDSILAANKKDENFDAVKEAFGEDQSQENKDSTLTTLKKDETTTDTPIVVEEEKVQENKETIVAEVKKEETIADAPIVVEEEKVQENKETVVAEVKKEETIADAPIVVEEEKVQKNKETVVAEVKKEETIAYAPIVVEEEKVQENKETVVAELKKEETIADAPIVVEEEKVQENKETVVAEVKKEETIADAPIVVEEEKVPENKETVVAEVKKEETIADAPIVVEEEKVQENKETVVSEVKKEETIADAPIIVEEEKVQENKETVVAEVKKEETIADAPIVVEEEKTVNNKDTLIANVKTAENEDTSKEALLKKNQELAMKIEALEQKHKAQMDSIVNASWGADPNLAADEQDIMVDSANLESVNEQTDTTVVAGNAEEENTSENGENGEQSEIVADENAGSAEDSLSMEIKNIGLLVNSRFPDYAPLIHADGNVMIFSTNRPLTETPAPITPPSKKGKPQKLENKGGKANIYTSYYDLKDKKWLAPRKLGPTINLPDVNNSAIALSNDGQKMILYRYDGNQTENGDLFESSLNGEEWSPPLRLPASINSNDNETSASISPDGKTIYFVSNRKLGVGEKDIWYSTQENNGIWGNAVNIGESINTDKDEESVFIHPNGNTLFFSSKGHTSIGGYDIFMSVLDSATGEWGTPKNLGRSINTIEDDMYFTLAANGKKGYYSSAKPNGIGESDIYSVVLGADIIKKNTTLVKGFITDENGEGIKSKIEIIDKSTDETFGVFNSNRITGKYLVSLPTGKKYDLKITADGYTAYIVSLDISFKTGYNEIVKNIVLETKNVFITSRMFNETGKPISVMIEAIDKGSLQLIDKSESDNEGYSKIAVPSGKELDIFFSKPGYLFQSVNLSIPKSTEFESKDLKNITMQKVGVGKKTVLKAISFDFNQTTPLQESFLDIDRIVTLMKDVASVEIEISGHTDNVGSKKDNSKLSNERAKALVDILISKGIDKKRLEYKGYGSNEPIGSNDTDSGRKANNRTELKVLKVDLKAEELAEEKRIKEAPIANTVSLKPDETIVSVDEKQVEENKDTATIADKKDGNTNDTPVVVEEEKIQENKETVIADIKKDESTNDTPVVVEEEKIQENKETVIADVKKDENTNDTPVVVEEEKIQENKETVIADVKKDENTNDTPVVVEEEKTQENKETIVADVKKDEDTNETPVVVKEEKIQKNKEKAVADVKKDDVAEQRYKARLDSIVDASWAAYDNEQIQAKKETVVADVKKDENTNDTPIVTEEEKLQENKEKVVADVKKDDAEQKYQARLDSVVNASWGSDPNEQVLENKETELATDKKDANTDDTPIVAMEEKIQENKETDVADVKKDENTNESPIVKEEEKLQENKKTVVADVKKDDAEQKYQARLDSIVNASWGSDPNEQVQENKETELATDKKDKNTNDTPIVAEEEKIQENKETVVADVKKDENTNDTPVVKEEEKTQENKETVVADVKKDDAEQKYQARLDSIVNASWGSDPNEQVQENKETELATDNKNENTNDTPVVTEEEKIQENSETNIADKKETNNSGNFPRHTLESYATDKKDKKTKPNKVEIIHEKQDPVEVVADKKEETTNPSEEEQSEETKEATLAVNADANADTKKTTEATKSINTSTLPERYKEFDKDVNGTITYDEIIKMIDSFFDDAPNVKQEDITSIIDYFFSD